VNPPATSARLAPVPRLLFGVMREDSIVERTLLERPAARSGSAANGHDRDEVLVVASGGCTALDLVADRDTTWVTAFDQNPAQLALVEEKRRALQRPTPLSPTSPLLHGGAFEGLFRLLRAGFLEFIVGEPGFSAYFDEPDRSRRTAVVRGWQENPYFQAVFAAVFHDELLWAMFGEAATQHAPPGSYPGYFAQVFASGLLAEAGPKNRFLQHVFLQTYWPGSFPSYLRRHHEDGPLHEPLTRLSLVEGSLLDIPSLERFRLVSLSNIFDWSDDALVRSWAAHLASTLAPGALVVVRKLNNQRDVAGVFTGTKRFRADETLADAVTKLDQSLFYERFEVFVRNEAR
jgi:S-adenosylmethionine-diacylglycerol 3-amino-3-carboxypropyl transferase